MKKLIKGFLLLAMALVVVTACKKDKKDGPAIVPKVDITNVITGKVFNAEEIAVTGVNVVCELNGSKVANATTTASGYRFDKLTAAGVYKLIFTKSGFTTTTVSVKVVSTQKAGAFITQNIVLNKEGRSQKATTDATGKTNAETEISIPVADYPVVAVTKVIVPAATVCTDSKGAPVTSPTIVIAPANDIVSHSNPHTAMPIAVLNCQPEGIKFSKPVPITFASPLRSYEILGMKLFLLDPATGGWMPELTGVTYTSGVGYGTSVIHFSSYKIGVDGAVISSKTETTPFTIKSIDNMNGQNPISVQTVKVTNKSGYIFTTTPTDAVKAAGISDTDTDRDNIISLITNSVKSRNGGFAAVAEFVSTQADYPMVMSVNPGVNVDFTANNEYLVETLQFKFKDSGSAEKTVTVVTKKATGVSVSYNAYNRDHTGGSGK